MNECALCHHAVHLKWFEKASQSVKYFSTIKKRYTTVQVFDSTSNSGDGSGGEKRRQEESSADSLRQGRQALCPLHSSPPALAAGRQGASDSPGGRKSCMSTTGLLSQSELLLLQLPQLPRLARTLPEELPQSELESEQNLSAHFFSDFW